LGYYLTKVKTKFPLFDVILSMFKQSVILYLSIFCAFSVAAQDDLKWADSVFRTMTLTEQVSQLFMVPVSARRKDVPQEAQIKMVQQLQPGGILLSGGTSDENASLIRSLQQRLNVPVLVATNAEWGLAQSLDLAIRMPVPMVMGAIKQDSLIYLAGKVIGEQMNALGIHVNFALNADIDVPDANVPVAYRYLTDRKSDLIKKGGAFIQGLQSSNIIAVVKHIPGRSEETAPDDFKKMIQAVNPDTLSFLPIQKLLQAGAGGVNTAYLHFGMLENNETVPAALSQLYITEYLKNKIGYDGLIFTEAPFLKSLVNMSSDETAVFAFTVGNHMIITSENPEEAILKIIRLVRKNEAMLLHLEQTVRKILLAKYHAGLKNPTNFPGKISEDLLAKSKSIKNAMAGAAVTVLANRKNFLPVNQLHNRKFFLLNTGTIQPMLEKSLSYYVPFKKIMLGAVKDTALVKVIKSEDVVIVSFTDQSKIKINKLASWLAALDKKTNLVVLHSGNPYNLRGVQDFSTLVEGYHPEDTDEIIPQIIFGGIGSYGRLPVQVMPYNGLESETLPIDRLSYGVPEQVGMSSITLNRIDAVAKEAISSGATPGCRVLIAKDGMVIFNRSYGWLSYDRQLPVSDETIYDLASVTKVSATLQATMFMYDKGLIDLHKKASVYLPELKNSNKKDFVLKDILTHQSGLFPYVPFWARTMKDSTYLPEFYASSATSEYPLPVAENLFGRKTLRDSLWQWTINSKINERQPRVPHVYKYSDMSFYVLHHLAERRLNQPMEKFLSSYLYEKLGAYTTTYQPLNKFRPSKIAPTEQDRLFRKSLLIGYVHDQGAAMHGGIAGHAGLFSTANDLAKVGQMWLQKGSYGGTQYFNPKTIEFFSSRYYRNSRRALGWDKSVPGDPNGPTSMYASHATFGHTGFTGTCIWVDPVFNLVYIFLSNRVHPDMTNNKLIGANIRTRIHDITYQSIFDYKNRKETVY
jgi:beta-N-acetylhexosaminidase